MDHLTAGWARLAAVSDYGGAHQPPDPSYSPPLHDLSEAMPDVYEHPEWYGHGGQRYDRESAAVLLAVRDNPSARVTIYRALPPTAPTQIERGNWVAIAESYARQHGMDRGWDEWVEPKVPGTFADGEGWVRREGDWPVIAATVAARDVYWGGNDIIEYGYWGPTVQARVV